MFLSPHHKTSIQLAFIKHLLYSKYSARYSRVDKSKYSPCTRSLPITIQGKFRFKLERNINNVLWELKKKYLKLRKEGWSKTLGNLWVGNFIVFVHWGEIIALTFDDDLYKTIRKEFKDSEVNPTPRKTHPKYTPTQPQNGKKYYPDLQYIRKQVNWSRSLGWN